MVEKITDRELDNEILKDTQMNLFDFYPKSFSSGKEIYNLKKISNFEISHKQDIFKLLLLEDGRVCTCSEDATIRISHLDSNIPEKVLIGHTKLIGDIIMLRSGQLCSSSWDGTVRIWNIEESICEKIVSVSMTVIALMELPDGRLVSGEMDSIRFWSLNVDNGEYACTRTLFNKGYGVTLILLNNEEMACTSESNINIFRVNGSKNVKRTLVGHRNDVGDLLLHLQSGSLLSSSGDRSLRMWNIQTGRCIRTFWGDRPCYKMVWFKQNVIAAGYANGKIKFLNAYTGECMRVLDSSHGTSVFGLVVDSKGNLISGSSRTLTMWGD